MRTLVKVAVIFGVLVLILTTGFVILVGPWPTYSGSFEGKRYFRQALADIDANARESAIAVNPGRLQAGWGKRCITPPKPGVPMAGYGNRRGAPSTGVHDDVYVKALALSDGVDTAVLVGADILIVPENVAEMVREEVARRTPLTANDVYFSASHTHCSVGAFGPGLAAYVTGGKYDPEIPPFLTKAFTGAIVDAYQALEAAGLAHGGVEAEEYIRNRTREGPVDAELSYLLVEQDDGDRCYLVSYSAHPTILSGRTMEYSGEYPGYLQRAIEATGAFALYLGGAVGSMGPRAPGGPDGFARAQAMGEALAGLVLNDAGNAAFETNLDVVSLGVLLDLPPLQVRVRSPKWRFSKFLGPLVGIDGDGWMHGVRVGNIVFVGTPCDLSGEISVKWKETAAKDNYDLWATSFCADYAGYVSPDKYYHEVTDANGNPAYETGLMSWTGPHQEAYFTALKDRIVSALTGQSP